MWVIVKIYNSDVGWSVSPFRLTIKAKHLIRRSSGVQNSEERWFFFQIDPLCGPSRPTRWCGSKSKFINQMSIGLFLPLDCLIWGKHVIICSFRVQKSRKSSYFLQLAHFVGPQTPRIDVGHFDFFCKKFSKGYTLPQKWLFGEKSHLKPIFELKCVKIVNFPIIPIHLYRKTPDFHKSRYLAPVARGWPKLFTDFECMSCRELMGQVPIWVPEADKKCHFKSS